MNIKLLATGELLHFEYLAEALGLQRDLVEQLERHFEADGTVVSWNMSFEAACNSRMAKLLPDKAAFLDRINARTVNLQVPFKLHYVDGRCRGSTSIKKVLPVLVPELSYDEAKVHDGTGAMLAWLEMLDCPAEGQRTRLRNELTEYCKLDTLAMVKIYEVLSQAAA